MLDARGTLSVQGVQQIQKHFQKNGKQCKQQNQANTASSSKPSLLEMVENNKTGYMARQIDCVNLECKLYHNVELPTVEAFRAMLKGNMIKNCQVTTGNVVIAEKIYGPAIFPLVYLTDAKTSGDRRDSGARRTEVKKSRHRIVYGQVACFLDVGKETACQDQKELAVIGLLLLLAGNSMHIMRHQKFGSIPNVECCPAVAELREIFHQPNKVKKHP